MTIAIPKATVKKSLPSFSEKSSTIDLDDLMKLMAKNMRGTEFYANGHPTLTRLALQSRAKQLISSVKRGAKK